MLKRGAVQACLTESILVKKSRATAHIRDYPLCYLCYLENWQNVVHYKCICNIRLQNLL